MAVISFGDNKAVWGSSASFLRGLIEDASEMLGEREYLQHFGNLMEWNYNAIDLTELHVVELEEFIGAIPPYRDSYLTNHNLSDVTKESAAELCDTLAEMIRDYIKEREGSGSFVVNRDFWTLKQ